MDRGYIPINTRLWPCLTILQAKKSMTQDPRYDAIGSSSLREELFNTFMKGIQQPLSSRNLEAMPFEPAALTREERRERAVREREEKVKAERSLIELNIKRSRIEINQEESERDYKCGLQFYRRRLDILMVP